MDPETLSQLLSPTGWALLGALPPYDDKQALALSERLHREGLDPRLVAGARSRDWVSAPATRRGSRPSRCSRSDRASAFLSS